MTARALPDLQVYGCQTKSVLGRQNIACQPNASDTGDLTRVATSDNIVGLRDFLVSIKKASTLDGFKLFYEELTFSSKPNRIRRFRVVTSVK